MTDSSFSIFSCFVSGVAWGSFVVARLEADSTITSVVARLFAIFIAGVECLLIFTGDGPLNGPGSMEGWDCQPLLHCNRLTGGMISKG